MKVNYYEVLGVERSADAKEIRERFRKLARENHPDRYKGQDKVEAERKFQNLTEAVNVLTDVAKRRQHDSELATGGSKVADFIQIAKVYVKKGMDAFKAKDFVTAYENFDMAVKHNPQDAKAQYNLAMTAQRIPTHRRKAVEAIEAAVKAEPMNATYLKEAGLILKKAGLTAKSERYLEQALQWDPDSIELQTALAELRQGRGDTKESGRGFGLFKKG